MPNIKEYIKQPFEFEKELSFLFGKDEELVVLDIGACEGEDSIKFSKYFPNSKIYTFEPLPNNLVRIKANFKKYDIKNAKIINKALSNKSGKATFHVSSGNPPKEKSNDWDYGNKSSSLLAPAKAKTVHSWLNFNKKITVTTARLEDILRSENISVVDFVYMDVQGAEKMVLEGAGDYIRSIKAVWLEVESVELYKNQPLKDDIELFMRTNGFRKIKDTVNDISGDQLYLDSELFNKYKNAASKNQALINKLKSSKNKLIKMNSRIKNRKPNSTLGSRLKYSKRSYSQTGEDTIIKAALNEIGITKPTYIDIGAHDPFYLNNTAIFYENGCRGVNIEPDPILFNRFKKSRKKDTNLNIGIANKSGTLDLYIMSSPTLNTFSAKEARYYEEQGYPIVDKKKVKVDDINTILQKYFKDMPPNILSIDVEGLDYQIIKSIDYKKHSPDLICAETIKFSKDGSGEKDTKITTFLLKNGYKIYADTKINTIYVLSK